MLGGVNLGRFALATARRDERVRALLRSVARVVVPSVLWIGGVSLVTGAYPLPAVLLVAHGSNLASDRTLVLADGVLA